LAEKADLHRNYIGEVERGEKTISVDALMRVAAALNVSIHDFFPGL
jgi:transcriptional regulator with XRE-family HTH domain